MNNGLHEHLKVFVAIAQARSLTGASIATGIGQATISRQLAALERHLGCRLFQRSTRTISLTDRGEVFLQHALRILELTAQAEAAVQPQGAMLRGRIRVACSNGFGRRILIPTLAHWQRLHPQVEIELVLSDQVSQLIEERELLDGLVVRLLPDYTLPAQTIHAVTATRPASDIKVSTFITFVEQTLRAQDDFICQHPPS